MKPSTAICVVLLLALFAGTAGCQGDSFFTRPPTSDLTADSFFDTEADLQMATAALYNKVWYQFNNTFMTLVGDTRAGNVWSVLNYRKQFAEFSITAENTDLSQGWQSLYLTIAHANQTIANIRERSSSSIPEEAKLTAIAEARFMRGWAYAYLAQLWGPVPIITNTSALIDQPQVPLNREEDVYQFALNDLEFAAAHLPEEREQLGRVNMWSAKGALAQMYYYRAGFRGSDGAMNAEDLEMARRYAEDVIKNNPDLELREDFGDLFLFSEEDTNNRMECLFCLQWTFDGANSTYGTFNSLQSYRAYEPLLTGEGDAWGRGTSIQGWLINAYEQGDERRPETFMKDGDYYPELVTKDGGYTFSAGNYTGEATAMKKYVIGRAEDNDGQVGRTRTGIDTYMLRLAEIYLIYAEAIMGGQEATSDPEALEYFNRVRERANLSPKTTITRQDIFMEKWKELALEGQNWYDLVQLHDYNPSAAIAFITEQRRGWNVGYTEEGEIEVTEPDNWTPLQVDDHDFTLVYPETDILQNALFNEAPVPFDFSKQDMDEYRE